ncbi:hypothetical protein HK097_001560 [Rhizophlyctis rosea]|uniref:Uncharacterized protein n=1 Tax=Rhizophlyctis rosea TaxID=64517 RepID=A0AAD5S613_9FUNG|nr:hypothetical protein HK097_001560 [Rhizophlyctis rosea]
MQWAEMADFRKVVEESLPGFGLMQLGQQLSGVLYLLGSFKAPDSLRTSPFTMTALRKQILKDWTMCLESLAKGELRGNQHFRMMVGKPGLGKTSLMVLFMLAIAIISYNPPSRPTLIPIYYSFMAELQLLPSEIVLVALLAAGYDDFYGAPEKLRDATSLTSVIQYLREKGVRVLLLLDEVQQVGKWEPDSCQKATAQLGTLQNDVQPRIWVIASGSSFFTWQLLGKTLSAAAQPQFPAYDSVMPLERNKLKLITCAPHYSKTEFARILREMLYPETVQFTSAEWSLDYLPAGPTSAMDIDQPQEKSSSSRATISADDLKGIRRDVSEDLVEEAYAVTGGNMRSLEEDVLELVKKGGTSVATPEHLQKAIMDLENDLKVVPYYAEVCEVLLDAQLAMFDEGQLDELDLFERPSVDSGVFADQSLTPHLLHLAELGLLSVQYGHLDATFSVSFPTPTIFVAAVMHRKLVLGLPRIFG